VRPFTYVGATVLDEAVGLLRQHGPDARLMAGGTALVLLMKLGLVEPAVVIGLRMDGDLRRLHPLQDGGLEIGALVTHREAERAPEVRAYCPALADAFSRVATIRIRNQATVGGSLAHADPAQDPLPMLLALDAALVATGPQGQRVIPIAEFFVDYLLTRLAPDEILTAVRLPSRGDRRALYLKFLPRTADDYATVAVAADLKLGPDGRCEDARLALGAVGPVPLRVTTVEAALRGERLTAAHVRAAAALVPESIEPSADARGSGSYKREMARVWTERALLQLAGGPR